MIRTVYPGAEYGDGWPSGVFAVCLKGQHVVTHTGTIPLPQGINLQYVRVSKTGRIAGSGASGSLSDRALVWNPVPAKWEDKGLAFGPAALIWDAGGVLHVIGKAPAVGYRYVADDGRLVTCDQTRADLHRRLWDYTEHGDVTVGQGGDGPFGDDPAIVLYKGRRYLLEEGRCRSISFNREGNQLVVCFSRQDIKSHVRWLLSVSDITQLRDITEVVTPPPVPKPEPKPEPEPVPTENHLAEVKKARDAFASMPPGVERAWRVVNRAAQLIGGDYGLLAKTSGTNYNGYSIDILIRKGSGDTYDVLGDAEGEARPQWAPTQPTGHGDVSKWRPPVADDGGAQPPPVEPPPAQPPAYDDTVIKAELADLRSNVSALSAALVVESAKRIALEGRIANLKVTGSIGRSWGHSHDLSLKVEVEE